MKKVLIACEESQEECFAFRCLGVDAFSCDIKDCSGGFPEWHIKDDVRNIINDDWGLIIAHPPCTYLSKAGVIHLQHKGIIKDFERYNKGLAAKEFFMMFYNYNKCPIAIENPLPCKIFNLPEPDQIIQPYEFGDNYQKKTLLWLHGLPGLIPTNYTYDFKRNWTTYQGTAARRSKSSKYVAQAMANTWIDYIK